MKKTQKINRLRGSKVYKTVKRILIFIIITGIITAGSIFSFMLYYAYNTEPRKSDVMIVLGCRINGSVPSLMLQYRLNKALKLYKEGYAGNIIVSGGQGADEKFSESHIMKEWLQKKGIEGERIIEENKSTSTFENLKNSKKIMEERGFRTVVIVSNDYHMFRSLKLAERVKLKASGAPCPTLDYLKLYYYPREFLSVIKSFIFDR